ncbi:unnamed protein product [Schistosoma rodhaini]|uniref:Uncharacterized protein n=1 Tax=Schistosoma rodhaini TaxID=6188 RepID=A0AA85GDV6_9TREM|nr:unnamed protein product [Schistosoma rodhaini]
MYYVDYIQFNIQMDITYSWCIICLINLLLNGKFGQAQEDNPISFDNTTVTSTTTEFNNTTVTSTTTEFTNKPKVENSTTDGTTYTTTPSYFSTSTSTNDATNSKFQRIFYMIVGLISLMAIN